ncbi:MAG: two-component regulator propeller domain-containing protein [Bacteroidales bacterium]
MMFTINPYQKAACPLNCLFQRAFLGVFLLSVFFVLNAQDQESVKFDHFSSENIKIEKGLSQNWIYSIIQDKYGYMWFGTWEGLNKYDGYNFTIYNVNDGLSDHIIYTIVEDEEGMLWIGTDNGFNRFDRKNQTIKQYTDLPGDSLSLYQKRIKSIIQTKDGKLWLGSGNGLFCFDRETETITPYLATGQEYSSPRSTYVLHLFEDREGILWVSTTYGLIRFDTRTKRSTRYYHKQGDSTSLSHNNIRCVLQDKSGNFWIGTRKGLNFYDTSTEVIKHYFHDPKNHNSISGDYITCIYQDHSDNIWIGTESSGLNLFDKENKRFIRFQNQFGKETSLSNNSVYSIYEDRSGNIWVGTYNGVNLKRKYYNDFKHQKRTANNNTSLNNNIIWAFDEDPEGNLWIGTSEGINIKNKQTGLFSYLIHDPQNENSLSEDDIRALLYSEADNCVWIGHYGSGMDKYDLRTKKFTRYVPDPGKSSISDTYVTDIIRDARGHIWISTSRGLNRFNPQTNIFEKFYHSFDHPNSLSSDIVYCLFEDRHGNIWAGTEKGLNKYLGSEKGFERFTHDPNDPASLNYNAVFCIYEDKAGNLWIGTSGGGINKFNPITKKFKAYTTEQGLPNNLIYGIEEDEKGNLWISTTYGLAKFYVASETFVNYDVKDGLQSNEFNLGACYKDNEGRLYFGGMNGYNVFHPSEIKFNPVQPIVVITKFRKFNEIQPVEYFSGDTIRLNHDENFFSIEVAALDYSNPSKNKYKYGLENFDKDWILADASNRLAEYKKVRPGTYRFTAFGSNSDGIWNEKGVFLTIVIVPPWWETWMFRIIAVLILISLISLLVIWRIKRIRKKHEIEKKIFEIEKQMFDLDQKALRLQMNPHFIFNSLNSIQSYILTHNENKAVMYLSKFSQLMRLILANSSYKYISIKDELQAVKYYLDLEKLRFDNKFDYTISVDKSIDEDFVEIPPMIIQPYIENAIIHGLLHKPDKGHCEVTIKLDGDRIICTIQDDGVGREKAMEIDNASGIRRKSRGMLITKARLEILNRQSQDNYSVNVIDLKDQKGNPSGTKVVLNIHYKES